MHIKEKVNKILSYELNEELRFSIGIGLCFVLVTLLCASSVFLFNYLQLKMNLIVYTLNGWPSSQEFQEAFWYYAFKESGDLLIGLVGILLIVFFVGFYLSKIMMRPFKAISRHCDARMNKKEKYYRPDFLSDLKLLTNFSLFFFSRLDEVKEGEKLKIVEIPKEFTKIHAPSVEWSFFFNYFFIIVIFGLISSFSLVYLNMEFREINAEMSYKFLKNFYNIDYFLTQQAEVLNVSLYYFIAIHLLSYLYLGIFLYGKISSPAFAVFATMRSFLKGHYHNRIHLIGYYYLRNDCRVINKYLDEIQKKML